MDPQFGFSSRAVLGRLQKTLRCKLAKASTTGQITHAFHFPRFQVYVYVCISMYVYIGI